MKLIKIFMIAAFCWGFNGAHAALAKTTKLEPLFIEANNPSKGIIPTTQPDALDEELVALCGDWGSKVSGKDIAATLNKKKNYHHIHNIYERLGKKVLGTQEISYKEFKSELAELFERYDAFAHIFCGYSRFPGSSVGLCYAPRAQELQQKGLLGAYSKESKMRCRGQFISGDKYTVPMNYITPGTKSKVRSKCMASFVVGLHGADMITDMVRATRDAIIYASKPDQGTQDSVGKIANSDNTKNNSTNSKNEGRDIKYAKKAICHYCSEDKEGCYRIIVKKGPEIVAFYPNGVHCSSKDDRRCDICNRKAQESNDKAAAKKKTATAPTTKPKSGSAQTTTKISQPAA